MDNYIFSQLLSDIATIMPERLQHYEDLFTEIQQSRHYAYSFSYDTNSSTYELTYNERGVVTGGIKEYCADGFRLSFLQHEFFPIRYKTARADIEHFVACVYSLFEDKSSIEKRVEQYAKQYNFSTFDYTNMRFVDTP